MRTQAPIHVQCEEARVLAAHVTRESLQLARVMRSPHCAVLPEEIPNDRDVLEESALVEKVAGQGTSVDIDGEPVGTRFGVNIRVYDNGLVDT